MIRLLHGQIHSKDERTIILFVGGVGYHVFVTNALLSNAEASETLDNDETTLYIHTHVREDDITLYGFRTKNELKFFELVLTINGVGPKMALAILNEPPEEIQNAIFSGDIKALTKISGVGKKIAERIILELKNKVEPSEIQPGTSPSQDPDLDEDLVLTLETLGYKRSHIKRVLSGIEEEVTETEDLIRIFLQRV